MSKHTGTKLDNSPCDGDRFSLLTERREEIALACRHFYESKLFVCWGVFTTAPTLSDLEEIEKRIRELATSVLSPTQSAFFPEGSRPLFERIQLAPAQTMFAWVFDSQGVFVDVPGQPPTGSGSAIHARADPTHHHIEFQRILVEHVLAKLPSGDVPATGLQEYQNGLIFLFNHLDSANLLRSKSKLGCRLHLYLGNAFEALLTVVDLLIRKSGKSPERLRDAGSKPPAAAVFCCNWQEILMALGLSNNSENQQRVRSFNDRYDGPIILPPAGGQPKVDKDKLLEWWNGLEARFRESQQRQQDRKATLQDQFQHGKKNATVVPSIAGHIKKRKAKPSK